MGNLRDILLMEPGPERDDICKEQGIRIGATSYKNQHSKRFDDEPKQLWIPADPENRLKSEKIITEEHVEFCYKHNILFFHTKVKGEVQSIGNGQAVLKKSENVGFFDMILLFPGSIFVGLELKAGKGGYWSIDQMNMNKRVIKAGCYALVSNSVKKTEEYLKKHNLI